jgi:hypothetical protein
MDVNFENPQVIMGVLALLSVSAACLFTLYYLRDERRDGQTKAPADGRGFIRLSEYRREAKRQNRPAA